MRSRRSMPIALMAFLTSLTLGVSVLGAPNSGATAAPAATTVKTNQTKEQKAKATLERAKSALTQTVTPRRTRPDVGKPVAAATSTEDPSLLLRDLFVAKSSLSGQDRVEADALLARPTDGARDPFGDGYSVKSRKKCSTNICLHWVPRTDDAPKSMKFVNQTLRTMNTVWATEIGKMGYRRPIKDGNRGGNSKFDVYLSNVGVKGYYGYCAAEAYAPGNRQLASGYCVLDNDFSRAEFGQPPLNSMRVTAAHEFFHAIQYAYDLNADRWIMEATATWMEERVADAVNDNRQYLPAGQLRAPLVPLDTFSNSGFAQYGNWIFFEYLSSKYGVGFIRSVWNQSGKFAGGGRRYSIDAVRAALAQRKVNFAALYAQFAAANVVPRQSYPEGAVYRGAPVGTPTQLGTSNPNTAIRRTTLNHLTSRSAAFIPGPSLKNARYRLLLTVNMENAATGNRAIALVHLKTGRVARIQIPLNATGDGRLYPVFNSSVSRVTLVLANGSTRYNCWKRSNLACQGVSLDNNRKVMYQARVVMR